MCGTGLRDLKRLNGGREVGDSPSQILVSATIDFDATCSWTAQMFVRNLWGRSALRKCKMLKHIDLRLLRHSQSFLKGTRSACRTTAERIARAVVVESASLSQSEPSIFRTTSVSSHACPKGSSLIAAFSCSAASARLTSMSL